MANQIAYGFYSLLDKFPDPVTTVLTDINTAIDATIAEHNRQIETLYSLFCAKTTDAQAQFKCPALGRLMGADEYTQPPSIKGASRYTVAWPIQKAMIARGTTWDAAQKMTVQDANDEMVTLQTADIRWQRDHILAACFAATSWTHTNEEDGDLTILSLANGDTQAYLIQSGADAGATDTHVLGQADAIADLTDPYPTIYAELTEHPENGGKVIALIPTALKATTQALTSFYAAADPNIRVGSATAELVADAGVSVPGEIIGYHDAGVWIAEWKGMPSTHIIAVCTEGERALKMREEQIASLRGFLREGDRNDHPFYQTVYSRRAGWGANNRVGAVAYRVGNATYAAPTGYGSPMA